MEFVWCRIECLRQEMHIMALEKGISHPDVLRISQRLDKVINELYRLSMSEKIGEVNNNVIFSYFFVDKCY